MGGRREEWCVYGEWLGGAAANPCMMFDHVAFDHGVVMVNTRSNMLNMLLCSGNQHTVPPSIPSTTTPHSHSHTHSPPTPMP